MFVLRTSLLSLRDALFYPLWPAGHLPQGGDGGGDVALRCTPRPCGATPLASEGGLGA